MSFAVRALAPADFPIVERLFGPRGAAGGCWCMYWRLRGRAYTAAKGEPNRAAFRALVEAGEVAGVLALDGDEPIGWAQVGPKSAFARLVMAPSLASVDPSTVWSLNCVYVAARRRGEGVTAALVAGAIDLARARGARALEAYPVPTSAAATPAAFLWTGTPGMFARAGFVDVSTRPAGRRIYRLELA